MTRAIKRRAEDGLRTGRFGRDPVCWLHEHLAGGGGNMVVLARKDLHGPERKPWGLVEMVARDPDGLAIVLVQIPPDHPQRRAG